MSFIHRETENARLEALIEYRILDTVQDGAYDGITHIAKNICGVPIAGISFIDRRREWFKSKIGIEFNEIPRGISLSAYAIYGTDPFIIHDASIDERFSSNPIVTSSPYIRFYFGVPLVVKDVYVLGTLHAMDRAPRKLDYLQMETLRSLARQVTELLELQRRLTLLEQHAAESQRYGQQLEETNAKLEILAITDGLTGLRNRRAFGEHLQHEVSRANRYNHPLSLMLMDIDHFKKYNDTFGHPAGDELLKDVAMLINQNTRASDSVSRYGGDEFAVILPNTRRSAAKNLAERIRQGVESTLGRHRSITVSIGIGNLSSGTTDAATFISETDKALYRAKQDGRNKAYHTTEL